MRRAIDDGDRLVRQFPGARATRRAVQRARVRLSVLLLRSGRAELAEALLRDAPAMPPIPAKLADQSWIEPALNAQTDMQLASCILFRARDVQTRDEARDLLHSTCTTLERLAAEQPERVQFRVDLGASLSNLAALANQNGEHRQAADFARRAIVQQEQALKDEPTDRSAGSFRMIHYAQLAYAHAQLGDHDEARSAIDTVLASDVRNYGALRLAAESGLRMRRRQCR